MYVFVLFDLLSIEFDCPRLLCCTQGVWNTGLGARAMSNRSEAFSSFAAEGSQVTSKTSGRLTCFDDKCESVCILKWKKLRACCFFLLPEITKTCDFQKS